MTHRIEQVESTLKRVIAEVLQRSVSDPRIEGMVSITKVNVSDDMAAATVYVSVLPAEKQRTTVKGLEHAAVHVHGLAKKKLALRRVPRLTFRGDDELKVQDRTLRAIREAVERTDASDPSPAGRGWEGVGSRADDASRGADASGVTGRPHPGPLPGGEGDESTSPENTRPVDSTGRSETPS